MRYTIFFIETPDGKYTKETRVNGMATGRVPGIKKEDVDKYLEIKSPLFDSETLGRHGKTLREMLEWDAEYMEWISQMAGEADTTVEVRAIRSVIPFTEIRSENPWI